MQIKPEPTQHWQKSLAEGFNDLAQLCQYLEISPTALNHPLTAPAVFPLRVPLSFAACMEKGNPNDPLLRQVLPVTEELIDYPGYNADPVGDLAANTAIGLIHKYHGRALIITTGACAINCRYCFRRNFPYAEVQLTKSRLDSTLKYIKQHTELTEIILSGGDPLLLNDERLDELIIQLNTLKHIQRIRIHSRIPVVLPERITPELLSILSSSSQKIILVLHANHANELSPAVANVCRQLSQNNITLLNQSVLLKGVNDSVLALCTLSEKLFNLGVLPYYLHVLDKATGTGHFEVSTQVALEVYRQLQTLLPGYLVPKLVTEQAGAAYKMPLN
ncbi:MAG: EF-P beta-lysylation protein EpmB [Methylococcaceae bacterium]|nr:EF-P beta-lysylation protein EpmB [Methylococcaceae bacterium]